MLFWDGLKNLPNIKQGEDIDILVDDNDLELLTFIMEKRVGTIPFDIYTESGLSGMIMWRYRIFLKSFHSKY